MGSQNSRLKPTPASSSSSPSSGKKLAAATASKSLLKLMPTPPPTITQPLQRPESPRPPADPPEMILEYWISMFRFTGRPRPHLPYLPETRKNLNILLKMDGFLGNYLSGCKDTFDIHIVLFCGALAACELAGLKMPRVEPAPQAPLCDPWQTSVGQHGKKMDWPEIRRKIFYRGKGDNVLISEKYSSNGTGTKLIYYLRRYYSLALESRLDGITGPKFEVDANPPSLWPIFDINVRLGSLDLLDAGWPDAFSDSSIWIEQGIFRNGFQSPFWFRPSLHLVAEFMRNSGSTKQFSREAEMILHLLPGDASYKLLELKHWLARKYLIVILKIVPYRTADFEENFIVEKCALIHVDIKITRGQFRLPLFTTETLRSIGIKETYRCLNTQIPRTLEDQEPVDCCISYEPVKNRRLVLCRLKEMNGKQKRADREKIVRSFGPGGIFQEYGPIFEIDAYGWKLNLAKLSVLNKKAPRNRPSAN